jgi:hypothetical protein
LDEAGKWSPREDFNLHCRVRSPVVCALADEGMVVARGIEPRPRASEARVISVSPGDGGRGTGARTQTDGLKGRRAAVTACPRMGPPGRVELPLAAYRAATLRSVDGVVTSRGIEPRSLGLQPSAMTTPARWSLWWSRRRESNPRLRVTRAPCFRQHFVDVVPPAGVEPAWFRLRDGRMAALPRRGTTR